jgi:ribosome maturation factor RimP
MEKNSSMLDRSRKDELLRLAKPLLEPLGVYVADVWTFREDDQDIVAVYIRNLDGSAMDMNQCVAATHALNNDTVFETTLDGMIDIPFCLEVSSCSAGMVLRTSEDFSEFIGKTVQVQLDEASDGRKTSKGQIETVASDKVVLKTARGPWTFSTRILRQAEVVE